MRSICHNLLATLSRRPEAYHQKVLAGPGGAGGSVIDANTPVKFKQAGLERHLQYDRYSRKSLLDHFYDDNVSPEAIVFNQAAERGDFLQAPMKREFAAAPIGCKFNLRGSATPGEFRCEITKGVTLKAGSNVLEIAYLLEGLPRDRSLHFAVEFNFAGLPAGADDRYFHDHGNRLGQLGTQLNLTDVRNLNLCDQWLGIDAGLEFNRPTHIWTFPIETVSQSEGGFELVHQAVCVQPHWHVNGDADGRWAVVIQLTLDTTLAEQRQAQARRRSSGRPPIEGCIKHDLGVPWPLLGVAIFALANHAHAGPWAWHAFPKTSIFGAGINYRGKLSARARGNRRPIDSVEKNPSARTSPLPAPAERIAFPIVPDWLPNWDRRRPGRRNSAQFRQYSAHREKSSPRSSFATFG